MSTPPFVAPFALVPTRVPPGNIRVPEAEFEELYAELMAWHDDTALPFDNYVLGVEQALAWVADRNVVEDGRSIVPNPPLSESGTAARPETVAYEYLYALEEARARPADRHVTGVVAALDWAWNGGPRPLAPGWLAALYGYR
jgi:hypothetical protein